MSRPCYDEVAIRGERALQRLFVIVTLAVLIALPAGAQDFPESLAYDPSACQSDGGLAEAIAAAESAACLAMIAAHPAPDFQRARLDSYSMNHFSFWRVSPRALVYAAPGGVAVGQMDDGFNFVQAVDTYLPGWIQGAGGDWLRREDVELAEPSRLRGMLLPDNWAHPFAVILDMTGIYASLVPGGPRLPESGYVTRRYELVNIYAQAYDEQDFRWYLIGPRQWLRQDFVAKFAATPKPAGVSGRWMAVDLYEQTLIAYEDDKPVFATVVSTGLPDWSTRRGLFTIWARLQLDSMSGATGAPEAYDLQHVPWVMYFDGGISLHGTYWHDAFGYRRSRGCVNLSISDARWLYEWTAQSPPKADGEIVNQVLVYSTGRYALG